MQKVYWDSTVVIEFLQGGLSEYPDRNSSSPSFARPRNKNFLSSCRPGEWPKLSG